MHYKLIAIDLDDTLLNDELEISQENIEAIKYAHEKGVKIVICTGRPNVSIQQYIKQIGIYEPKDHYITFNGARISTIAGEVVFESYVQKDILKKLIEIGRKYKVDIQLYDDQDVLIENYSENMKGYEVTYGKKLKVIEDLHHVEKSLKLLYNSMETETLKKIKREIENEIGDEIFAFFSKEYYLEVLTREANKGIALAFLAKQLHIEQAEVIAIGDSGNDLYMITFAGVGVAMKNGRQELKEIADYVTSKDNNENGVAETIYKFIN